MESTFYTSVCVENSHHWRSILYTTDISVAYFSDILTEKQQKGTLLLNPVNCLLFSLSNKKPESSEHVSFEIILRMP